MVDGEKLMATTTPRCNPSIAASKARRGRSDLQQPYVNDESAMHKKQSMRILLQE